VTDQARYDGLTAEYDDFMDAQSAYFHTAAEALVRLLGPGSGRCLDLGCGQGHFFDAVRRLGWDIVGIDLSADQLRAAAGRAPDVELVHADAGAVPLPDESFDAGFSTFTHTDLDDFAGAMAEALRLLQTGARFVYIGNHPCFVGATQEHGDSGVPRLHPGYRRAGRCDAAAVPGATPGGWRSQLGSFVHVPLADFLAAFAGFTLERVEELDDGWEYPKTIAITLRKPQA
jgi:SAM-dependent methyltransferase